MLIRSKVFAIPLSPFNLYSIESLVLGASSEFDGFAGTGASSFGVLEYWGIEVLATMKG
jgi:hypothetical protein